MFLILFNTCSTVCETLNKCDEKVLINDPEHGSAHFFISLFFNHPSALCSFAQSFPGLKD